MSKVTRIDFARSSKAPKNEAPESEADKSVDSSVYLGLLAEHEEMAQTLTIDTARLLRFILGQLNQAYYFSMQNAGESFKQGMSCKVLIGVTIPEEHFAQCVLSYMYYLQNNDPEQYKFLHGQALEQQGTLKKPPFFSIFSFDMIQRLATVNFFMKNFEEALPDVGVAALYDPKKNKHEEDIVALYITLRSKKRFKPDIREHIR